MGRKVPRRQHIRKTKSGRTTVRRHYVTVKNKVIDGHTPLPEGRLTKKEWEKARNRSWKYVEAEDSYGRIGLVTPREHEISVERAIRQNMKKK